MPEQTQLFRLVFVTNRDPDGTFVVRYVRIYSLVTIWSRDKRLSRVCVCSSRRRNERCVKRNCFDSQVLSVRVGGSECVPGALDLYDGPRRRRCRLSADGGFFKCAPVIGSTFHRVRNKIKRVRVGRRSSFNKKRIHSFLKTEFL